MLMNNLHSQRHLLHFNRQLAADTLSLTDVLPALPPYGLTPTPMPTLTSVCCCQFWREAIWCRQS